MYTTRCLKLGLVGQEVSNRGLNSLYERPAKENIFLFGFVTWVSRAQGPEITGVAATCTSPEPHSQTNRDILECLIFYIQTHNTLHTCSSHMQTEHWLHFKLKVGPQSSSACICTLWHPISGEGCILHSGGQQRPHMVKGAETTYHQIPVTGEGNWWLRDL